MAAHIPFGTPFPRSLHDVGSWVFSKIFLYLAAAIVAGGLFLASAAIYAYFNPAPTFRLMTPAELPTLDLEPAPTITPNPDAPIEQAPSMVQGPGSQGVLASQIIGLNVYSSKNEKIGKVGYVLVRKADRRAFVTINDSYYANFSAYLFGAPHPRKVVPLDSITWVRPEGDAAHVTYGVIKEESLGEIEKIPALNRR